MFLDLIEERRLIVYSEISLFKVVHYVVEVSETKLFGGGEKVFLGEPFIVMAE